MSKLTVVAQVVARQDSVEAVKRELLKLIEPTRKEDGCIGYTLHQDNDDAAVFIFYETWENPACLEKHLGSDHFQAFVSAVGNIIEPPVINKMTLIA